MLRSLFIAFNRNPFSLSIEGVDEKFKVVNFSTRNFSLCEDYLCIVNLSLKKQKEGGGFKSWLKKRAKLFVFQEKKFLLCEGVIVSISNSVTTTVYVRSIFYHLKLESKSRIINIQKMKTTLSTLFKDHPGISIEDNTQDTAGMPREKKIVQYQETDFSLLKRLLALNGLYIRFDRNMHDKLVLENKKSLHSRKPSFLHASQILTSNKEHTLGYTSFKVDTLAANITLGDIIKFDNACYWVVSIEHRGELRSGFSDFYKKKKALVYSNSLLLLPLAQEYCFSWNQSHPEVGLYKGIIKSRNELEMQFDRNKIPQQCRLSHCFRNKTHGFLHAYRNDTEVVSVFMQNDFNQAIILGVLQTVQSLTPNTKHIERNVVSAWNTQRDNCLILSDKTGQESICLQNNNRENSVFLSHVADKMDVFFEACVGDLCFQSTMDTSWHVKETSFEKFNKSGFIAIGGKMSLVTQKESMSFNSEKAFEFSARNTIEVSCAHAIHLSCADEFQMEIENDCIVQMLEKIHFKAEMDFSIHAKKCLTNSCSGIDMQAGLAKFALCHGTINFQSKRLSVRAQKVTFRQSNQHINQC